MPKRITWIDFCRIYTAFFVIVRHVDRWYVGVPTINYLADLFNYRSLIFFFFLISGWFSHRPAAGQWVDGKRARQLAVPYVFWCLVGFFIAYSTAACSGDWSWLTPHKLAAELGLTSWCYWEFSNVPLWFLRTLIILAFFAPVLHRLSSKLLVVLVIFCFAGSDVLCDADEEACLSRDCAAHAQAWLPFRLYESVLACGFFSLGLLLRRHLSAEQLTAFLTRHAWAPIAAALLLLPYVLWWSFYPPVQSSSLVLLGVLTTMSIGCLTAKYLPRVCAAVASLAPAAFFIYVTHYPILGAIRYTLTGSWHGSLPVALCYILPFLILLISLALFYPLKKLFPRFMKWVALVK